MGFTMRSAIRWLTTLGASIERIANALELQAELQARSMGVVLAPTPAPGDEPADASAGIAYTTDAASADAERASAGPAGPEPTPLPGPPLAMRRPSSIGGTSLRRPGSTNPHAASRLASGGVMDGTNVRRS